jgi:plastocyanin
MRIISISRSASTSDLNAPRVATAGALALGVIALGVIALGASVARAQGNVAGQIRLVDRPGEGDHDLGDAVVWLEAPRRLVQPAASSSALAAGVIAMRAREFIPHVRIVRAGGSVSFPNDDPFSHNVFSNTTFGAFDLGLYRHGASRSASFDRPGVYPVYCNIHHRMVSFVVAVPTPWATQPAGDGRFVLRDVPPGSYVLHAWHERAGELREPVEVGADGATTVQLTLDARGYVPSPHLNKFGLPYSASRADRY